MPKAKVIVRVKGGLGNQLFCYAAARRLAIVSDAELAIDDVTGFIRDRVYRRTYALGNFDIPVRKATPRERMEPFERYRRGISKYIARCFPFGERNYIEQEGTEFDSRLLEFRVKGTVRLDGLWQSEGYFRDVGETIRKDLRMVPPGDPNNRELAERISKCESVCVHVRWYAKPGSESCNNVVQRYYARAIQYMQERVPAPHYYLFSDNPDASRSVIGLSENRVTFIDHNRGAENAYMDLWLMTHCKHFIIADSTFSWWGAWLAVSESKFVIAPEASLMGNTIWNFPGLIPDKWVLISPETRNG